MAKASEAKVAVSARVAPEVAADIEAIVKRDGKTKTDVIEELIRAGLDARNGAAGRGDASAEAVAQVLAALAEVRAAAGGTAQALAAVEHLPDDLADELKTQLAGAVKDVAEPVGALAAQVAALRRDLRTAVGSFLRIAFKDVSEEKAREVVRAAFES